MGRRKSSVVLSNVVLGVSLYNPTETFPRWRLVYRDPFTGQRTQPGYHSFEEGKAAFDQAVEYVEAARSALPPQRATQRSGAPTVDDVFERMVDRWRIKGNNRAYIEGREGAYALRVAPIVGHLSVMEWGQDDTHCLTVMAAVREAGLAPDTVQGYGAILRQMVTTAHKARWLPKSLDPMADVAYVAGNVSHDDDALFVAPKERPSTPMVDRLIDAYRVEGEATDRWWLWLMPEVGGFGGLRFGEQTALRARCYDAERHGVYVTEAWSHSRDDAPKCGPTKNRRTRFVFLRGSVLEEFQRRVAEVIATQGEDGLLFPGPKGATHPWTEGEMRNVFVRVATMAGWGMIGGGTTPKGQKYRSHPAIPYMNLRHHAASWLNERGFSWKAVSRTLGHHSVAFTLSRYVRVHESEDDENQALMAGC